MKYEDKPLEQLNAWKDAEHPAIPSVTFLAAITEEAEMRRKKAPVGFSVFLRSQIRFIGWKIWGMQTILLLCAMFGLRGMRQDAEALFFQWMPQILFYLSLLVSGVILPVLYRSFHYQMHEIETTTYYATPRILLAKLLVVGIGDIMVLSSLAVWMALGAAFPLGSAVLYLLCPFLLASFGIIYLIHHLPGKLLAPCCAVMYGILVLGYRFLRQNCPMAMGEGSGLFWGVVCLILLGLCCFQLLQIEKSSNFTELQLI